MSILRLGCGIGMVEKEEDMGKGIGIRGCGFVMQKGIFLWGLCSHPESKKEQMLLFFSVWLSGAFW